MNTPPTWPSRPQDRALRGLLILVAALIALAFLIALAIQCPVRPSGALAAGTGDAFHASGAGTPPSGNTARG